MDGTARSDITLLPPLGPTGVEPADVSVGWLAGTIRTDEEVGTGWALAKSFGGPSTLTEGNRHYRKGARADDWSWQVLWFGSGDASGTVYVEVRQVVFERLGPADGLALALRLLGQLRPSRLDLAADVAAAVAWQPTALFACREAAWTRTRRDGWVLTLQGDGGQKLTVGSRSSDRYLRVYVKGERVRHELELKGATAVAASAALPTAGAANVWAGQYGRLVRWSL